MSSATCIFCANVAEPASTKCTAHKYRRKCVVDDCFNQVYARLRCVSHGGKKLCKHPQCETPARRGSFCTKHAAKVARPALHASPCAVDGCGMQKRVGGYCWRHRNRMAPPTSVADLDDDARALDALPQLFDWLQVEFATA
ncbi:hypothetical protein SPRG_10140 [Saprolegnia parasitica CBS 223.65]|uniref:Uncharacterized protein n=1 Tax=Saprolegnia parasitica (strain CBS 223.65) TaxID=695850 RepID=A0A067C252_SAPPC|nr:hypothetical protein SPRG_10140 [Saprolegnia parasitica CBS 223.65]KDO24608.1 hypothetical protein SPRG_10140 [Saprolegnia parasitica CBS 223.65]|eukprot:XP_012204676.1 hypothetical protein SPRG_10140 [Saprolegnia parasitica CBS 223.65]